MGASSSPIISFLSWKISSQARMTKDAIGATSSRIVLLLVVLYRYGTDTNWRCKYSCEWIEAADLKTMSESAGSYEQFFSSFIFIIILDTIPISSALARQLVQLFARKQLNRYGTPRPVGQLKKEMTLKTMTLRESDIPGTSVREPGTERKLTCSPRNGMYEDRMKTVRIDESRTERRSCFSHEVVKIISVSNV